MWGKLSHHFEWVWEAKFVSQINSPDPQRVQLHRPGTQTPCCLDNRPRHRRSRYLIWSFYSFLSSRVNFLWFKTNFAILLHKFFFFTFPTIRWTWRFLRKPETFSELLSVAFYYLHELITVAHALKTQNRMNDSSWSFLFFSKKMSRFLRLGGKFENIFYK